jgi:4-amino-4-deoxy-L-arabinose transferase-like glycosyltransferase
MALARAGRFADSFVTGGGPTAHIGMLTPLPAAAAYKLFGIHTVLAEFALSVWAVGLVTLGVWLCWRLMRALDAPRAARVAAVAFVALVPLQFSLEVREGRSFEVNLAVVLLLWILLRLVTADGKIRVGARDLAITGALAGFLTIVSPPAGLAAVLAIGAFQLLRLRGSQWWIAPLAFALVAGPLAGFWAARNMVQLGEPIALRDNFGLELDLSNYSALVHATDQQAAYAARMNEIHPLSVGMGIDRLRAAGGEVPYYHQLGQEADHWILTHPSDFLYLSAGRFVNFFLPPRWFWSMFYPEGKIVWLRQFLIWAAAIPGFCTLALLAWRRRPYLYLLVATLACSAPYIVIQPVLRYRYLVSSLLIFVACDGVFRLAQYLRARRPVARGMARETARP